MEKATKRQKLFEARFISVGVEEREKTYRDKPPEKELCTHVGKSTAPPYPTTTRRKNFQRT